jgi:hypothetical protein
MRFAPGSLARRRLAWALFAVASIVSWLLLSPGAGDPQGLLGVAFSIGLLPMTFGETPSRPTATWGCEAVGVAIFAVVVWRLMER